MISQPRLGLALLLMKAGLALALAFTFQSLAGAQTKSGEPRSTQPLPIKGFEKRGGFVNFVAGEGRCVCTAQADAGSKQALTNGDSVELDEGRAEVVLSPGYYLRLSAHTTARLLDLSRDNLKIEITKGAAIVEIPIEDELQLPPWSQEFKERFFNIVTVITPGGEYAIFKAGGYRFDVTSNRESRMRVMKGAVAVSGRIVKGGTAAIMAGAVNLASDDKYVDDAFDKWSRERAATLVQSNKSLKQMEWFREMERGHAYLDVLDAEAPEGANAHVVSARNGVAGFVESGASIRSAAGDWRDLKADAQLADGDEVRTAPNNRAEIRLYPDFTFYLNGNTEMTYRADAEDNVSIDVLKGSTALFVSETKVKRAERNALKLTVNKQEFAINSPGYYRLNVFSNDESELLVYSGSVMNGSEIGAGKRIMMRGSNHITSSLDKESRDSFDIWAGRRTARTLYSPPKKWYAGLWFLNPETNEYTFVPGERVCKSPYGGSYSTSYSLSNTSQRVRPSAIRRRPDRL